MCGFLCSFFNSLLITKRNLLTHLDCLLVLAMTLLTSLMVALSTFVLRIYQVVLHNRSR